MTIVQSTNYRWRWVALGALLLAEAMNLLDTTVVQVAAPTIRAELGATAGQLQWLTAGYTLPFAVLLLTGGRAGDVGGRRFAFTCGTVVFVLCSLVCAVAPNVAVLMAARAVQGASAAFVVPQTYGLIRAMFRGAEVAKALGTIGPVMALAAVCGPVVGGALTQLDLFGSGWRAVFLVNVPLGVLVLLLVPWIREDRSVRAPRLDLFGTLLAAVGVGLLVFPLVQGNDAGWPRWTWICLGCGAVLLGAFALHQSRKARDPLVEPGLFRDRAFPIALGCSVLFFAVLNGLMFVLVVFFQAEPGHGPLAAGLSVLPWSVGLGAGSLLTGSVLVPRFGLRVIRLGALLLALGLASTAGLLAVGGFRLWVALLVAGTGAGVFTVPFFTGALSRVAHHETGSAAGLLNAVQQLGATTGVAVLGAVYLARGSAVQALWIGVAATVVVLALTYPMIGRPAHTGPSHGHP
ncbi:MAG: MFS transporter [Pseudonocardia sp.]